MLRRKLLARIGLLVLGFVAGAVIAIVLLQDLVRDVDRINGETAGLLDAVSDLITAITTIEAERLSGAVPSDGVHDDEVRTIDLAMEHFAAHPLTRPGAPAAEAFASIRRLLPGYLAAPIVDPVSAVPDPNAFQVSVALRGAVRQVGDLVTSYAADQHVSLARRFRLLVLGLTLAAILMVNTSVIVLLHTVHMILRPVDQLVDASRELAQERFEHRVEIDSADEFGELAHAYNRLAEQLAANEERKMETLRQVAVALNHDLNNTIAAIELELRLIDKQTGVNPRLADRFARMHQSLGRVAHAVRQLAHVRRIVLTEYMPGQMMLDLERSATDEEGPVPAEPDAPASPGVTPP
jgi:nitrate/nitrite-specific signal transduction histidine kinase